MRGSAWLGAMALLAGCRSSTPPAADPGNAGQSTPVLAQAPDLDDCVAAVAIDPSMSTSDVQLVAPDPTRAVAMCLLVVVDPEGGGRSGVLASIVWRDGGWVEGERTEIWVDDLTSNVEEPATGEVRLGRFAISPTENAVRLDTMLESSTERHQRRSTTSELIRIEASGEWASVFAVSTRSESGGGSDILEEATLRALDTTTEGLYDLAVERARRTSWTDGDWLRETERQVWTGDRYGRAD